MQNKKDTLGISEVSQVNGFLDVFREESGANHDGLGVSRLDGIVGQLVDLNDVGFRSSKRLPGHLIEALIHVGVLGGIVEGHVVGEVGPGLPGSSVLGDLGVPRC